MLKISLFCKNANFYRIWMILVSISMFLMIANPMKYNSKL